jgi:hypothetical protein
MLSVGIGRRRAEEGPLERAASGDPTPEAEKPATTRWMDIA